MMLVDSLKNGIAGLRVQQADNGEEMYQFAADDQTENDELLEALTYNNEQPDIVDPPFTRAEERS